jgi:hypothetical protein
MGEERVSVLRRSLRSHRTPSHDRAPAPGAGEQLTPGQAAPGTGPDLVEDVHLADGPPAAEVTRRAQHERARRRGLRAGAPRIGLVAVGVSAATVAVLAAGTIQGIRSDHHRATTVDQALVVAPDASTLPDGRAQDVVASRQGAMVARATVQERVRAQAAARAAAATRAAAQRTASARAAAQRSRQQATAGQASRSNTGSSGASSGDPKSIARAMLAARGWSGEWTCLNSLWERESGWNYRAANPSSGAYGIPQSLPGSKMASAGSDWRTNPATQIRWGLSYIASTYGTPCSAWGHSQSYGWY